MRSWLILAAVGLAGLTGCTTSGSDSTGPSPDSPPAVDSAPPTAPGTGPEFSASGPGPSGSLAPVTIPSGRVTLEVRPLIGPPARVTCGSHCTGDPFAALNRAGVAVPTDAAGFARLPAARRTRITTALGRADCATTGRQHGPYLIACDHGQDTGSRLAFLLGEPVFVAADVRTASATAPDSSQGLTAWSVLLRLTRSASNALAKWTAAHNTAGTTPSGSITGCAPSGTPCDDYLAVVVDGYVLTAPYNNSSVTGGLLQLTGGLTRASAERLAAGLP